MLPRTFLPMAMLAVVAAAHPTMLNSRQNPKSSPPMSEKSMNQENPTLNQPKGPVPYIRVSELKAYEELYKPTITATTSLRNDELEGPPARKRMYRPNTRQPSTPDIKPPRSATLKVPDALSLASVPGRDLPSLEGSKARYVPKPKDGTKREYEPEDTEEGTSTSPATSPHPRKVFQLPLGHTSQTKGRRDARL